MHRFWARIAIAILIGLFVSDGISRIFENNFNVNLFFVVGIFYLFFTLVERNQRKRKKRKIIGENIDYARQGNNTKICI